MSFLAAARASSSIRSAVCPSRSAEVHGRRGGAGEVVIVSRHELLTHLHNHPEAMLSLLRSLSMRVRAADEKIKILGFLVNGEHPESRLSRRGGAADPYVWT